jgi:acyl-CoA thioester hydrolase
MEFNHTLPIQLRFNDVDPFGHVNNSVYFTFYDLGKNTYLSDIMNKYNLEHSFSGIVVVNINANFLLPVYANDHVAVQTAVVEIGHKSFTLMQQLINTDTKEVKCTCSSVMVAFDVKTRKTLQIPQQWKEAFTKFEGHDIVGKYKE